MIKTCIIEHCRNGDYYAKQIDVPSSVYIDNLYTRNNHENNFVKLENHQ